MFALYVDSIVDRVRDSRIGCYLKGVCMSVLLYADDILLVAPSVSSVNKLLHMLDIASEKVCMCIRIGSRFRNRCCTLSTTDRREIKCMGEICKIFGCSCSVADPEIVGGGCGRVAGGHEPNSRRPRGGEVWGWGILLPMHGGGGCPHFFSFWTSNGQFRCIVGAGGGCIFH